MGRIEHTLLDEGRKSSPTDLRPSPALSPYHTNVTDVAIFSNEQPLVIFVQTL